MYWVKYVYKMNRYLSTKENSCHIFLLRLCDTLCPPVTLDLQSSVILHADLQSASSANGSGLQIRFFYYAGLQIRRDEQ